MKQLALPFAKSPSSGRPWIRTRKTNACRVSSARHAILPPGVAPGSRTSEVRVLSVGRWECELSPWDLHPAAGDTKPTRPLSLLPAAETRSAVAGGTPSDAARITLELIAQSLGFAPRTIRLTAGRSTVELGLMGSPRIALGLSGFQPGTLLIKLRALDSLTRSRTWISTFAEWCPVCWTMRDNPPWTRTTIT